MERCMRWFLQISVLYGPTALGMPNRHKDNGVTVYPRVLDTREDNSAKTVLLDGYSLSLSKASVFAEIVQLRELTDAGVTERYVPGAKYERHLYQDAAMKASLLLKPQAHGHYHIAGLVNFTHLIRPITNEEKAPSGEIPHKISRIRSNEGRYDVITTAKRSLPSKYNIETYIMHDNSLTRRMRELKLDTMDCTATLISQANLLLRNLEPPGTIVVTGIQSSFKTIETYSELTHDNQLQAEATAERLFEYAAASPRMQQSDVIILMTWLHMVGYRGDGSYIKIDGHTILGGACTRKKVVIVKEDPGQYSAVQATAHEVAHSLGSSHDGIGSSSACPENKEFLMYPWMFPPSTKQFSECTQKAVRAFLRMDLATCLFTDSSKHIPMQT